MNAQKTQSINEGDVIEGIFAIACALYLANGRIEKYKLNAIRTKIEPSKFISGPVTIQIKKPTPIKLDFVSVELQVRLKRSAHAAFGDDAGFYIQKQSDIGKLDEKINTLIRTSTSSGYLQRLKSTMNAYIQNNKSEHIDFVVVADGMEGEKSSGEIKGDVVISLFVKQTGRNNFSIAKPEVISYSLKSKSRTVSNLSVWAGGHKFIKHFSLPDKQIQKYKNILDRNAFTGKEHDFKDQAARNFFQDVFTLLQNKRTSITNDSIDYIQKHVLGSDQATLIEVNEKTIKEIPPEKFDKIRESKIKIKAITNAKRDTIKFVDEKNHRKMLFQIRLKIAPKTGGKRALLVEIGNLLK